MRLILICVVVFAANLGAIPDAHAGPILERVRERRTQRPHGCQLATVRPTAPGCASCAACQAVPATAPITSPSPVPTVQLWGGSYYQTAPAFPSGCPSGTCAPRR